MIRQCCDCGKILCEENGVEPIGAISHGYCEPCYDKAMNEINKFHLCYGCQNSYHENNLFLRPAGTEHGQYEMLCQRCIADRNF